MTAGRTPAVSYLAEPVQRRAGSPLERGPVDLDQPEHQVRIEPCPLGLVAHGFEKLHALVVVGFPAARQARRHRGQPLDLLDQAVEMRIAGRLAELPGYEVTVSLAGRVREIVPHPVPVRVGGFGGVDGLVAWVEEQGIDLLIDATHPFAERMSRNAVVASIQAPVRLLALRRPPWTRIEGDRWLDVDGMREAVAALGDTRRRVFLAIGRQEVDDFARAPGHFYLVRSIDRTVVLYPMRPIMVAIWLGESFDGW